MSNNSEAEPSAEQPLVAHLLELRDRLIRMVLAILVFFLALFAFANDIYLFIAEPLMSALPEGNTMIATGVASPFLTPFKLSLVSAVFLSMPYLLYQFWGFVAPGLYKKEKRLAFPLLSSSILLFYAGAAFAYYVVFPLVFAFMVSVNPDGVAMSTDISQYLDFVLMLFFAFGFAFEVPVATVLLVLVGMTTPKKLTAKRPYIIVGAFVIGMFLTPPDIISQTLLAIPMWILFELGVVFARMAKPNADKEDEDDDDEDENTIHPQGKAADADAEDASYTEVDDGNDYLPMTEAEMDAELDRIEEEEEQEFRSQEEIDKEAQEELDAYNEDDYDYDEDVEYPEVDESSSNEADSEATEQETPTEAEPDYSESSEVPEDDDEPIKPAEPSTDDPETRGKVLEKLEKVMKLREELKFQEARQLLYEVLVEGNETQIKVARNILEQLDDLND